ncbi:MULTISPECIES: tetratricopeptide repeat protein [unclassified Halorhodospira]|uniref:tetratricopeptide repeat protein n=1 Tax=unclassified Halorhodospira TaxID=2626748 RepID=UPI001EE9524C|nr:tetratricopeptide repeat protein [Halorhodospira sp. M39old]MCG5545895.1 tetratricopeptide repeat protein [Halorhodospira sp. M38]
MPDRMRSAALGLAGSALILATGLSGERAGAQPLPTPDLAEASLVAAHEHISDRDARQQLARLLSWQPERRAEALAEYRRLLQETPHDPALVYDTAELLHWIGDDAAAADLLAALPEGVERTRASLLLQARAEFARGRTGRARTLLEGLQPLRERAEQQLYIATLTASGVLHGAETALRELLDESPEDHELRRQLGDLLQAQGRPYAAEHQYARILATDPDDDLARRGLQGLAHRTAFGSPEDTEPTPSTAEPPADPRSGRDYLKVAEHAAARGKREAAEAAARRALALDPELTRASYLLADQLIARGALAEAEEPLAAILQRFPDATQAGLTRARLASWQGDYERALEIYDTLAEANPTDPTFAVEAARVAGWAGDRKQSKERYAALLNQLHSTADAEDEASARPVLITPAPEKAPLPAPAHPDYPALAEHRAVHQEAHAKALVQDRQPRAALAVLQRAARFQPHNLETAFDQSEIECTLGLCDAERATYRRVLEMAPGHAQAGQRLAHLERRRGPRAGVHAEYRDESGRDAELEILGLGVHGSLPVAARGRGYVSVDRLRYRFDPDANPELEQVRGNRVHARLRNVVSAHLSWRAELAHTRFDDADVDDATEGRAEAEYHPGDRVRTRVAVAQERVLRNPATALERLDRRLVETELDYYADRHVDLTATARAARYTDSNRGVLLQFQPRVRLTEHPHQLTGGATFQYRDTRKNEGDYWTPQDYLAAGPFLEWQHDLAEVFGCRALNHEYRIRLSGHRDSEQDSGTRLAGAYLWDAGEHLQLATDAFIERSSEWDAEGVRLSATWHFH